MTALEPAFLAAFFLTSLPSFHIAILICDNRASGHRDLVDGMGATTTMCIGRAAAGETLPGGGSDVGAGHALM